MEERFFVHRLNGSGDVAMPLRQLVVRTARGTEQTGERRREQLHEAGRAVFRDRVDLLALMAEVIEVQVETAVLLEDHNLPHLPEVLRLAIGREAHDFVFVAVMRKPEVLRQRLVKDSEGMWEV